MKYKEFDRELWQTLKTALRNRNIKNKIAAFDADGTLWGKDAGEAFFEHQINHCQLELPEEPLKHYLDLKLKNPTEAYLFLARINKGKTLDQVRGFAEDCLKNEKNWPYFLSQKILISYLKDLGFEVFVVTASVKWAVEPFAKMMGIDEKHVLGVTTKVKNNIITDEQDGFITYREGKALKLLESTSGEFPFLSSGNSFGDLILLESATDLRLCIHSEKENESLKKEELKLKEVAKKKNWLTHEF